MRDGGLDAGGAQKALLSATRNALRSPTALRNIRSERERKLRPGEQHTTPHQHQQQRDSNVPACTAVKITKTTRLRGAANKPHTRQYYSEPTPGPVFFFFFAACERARLRTGHPPITVCVDRRSRFGVWGLGMGSPCSARVHACFFVELARHPFRTCCTSLQDFQKFEPHTYGSAPATLFLCRPPALSGQDGHLPTSTQSERLLTAAGYTTNMKTR